MKRTVFAALVFLATLSRPGAAQCARDLETDDKVHSKLVGVSDDSLDRLRIAELRGYRNERSLLLRSPSSLSKQLDFSARTAVRLVDPQFLFVTNSYMPLSQNRGNLWAGKGLSRSILFGGAFTSNRIKAIIAPELVISENADWALRDTSYYVSIDLLDRRGSEFAFPYYVGPYSIDQPLRFGDKPLNRVSPGQSSILLRLGSVAFGLSTENEWWGPGIRNALIMSNNAPGFSHLTFRTEKPFRSRIGEIEGRWFVGELTESKYFDSDSTNNMRSIAGLGVVWKPAHESNFSGGFARTVYATARDRSQILWRWTDVFRNTGHPNERPLGDSTLTPGGRDQLFSLFARWVFPEDGAEVYAELGRTELPRNLRDLLIAPNHTQGYTIGGQWISVPSARGSIRLQAEITQVEQSATFRTRSLGSWYTSRRVIQGYTNRGEVIGASIGPGASSQWLAVDYVRPSALAGLFFGRIRWNEDMHSTASFPGYVAYCNHDVSLFWGLRGVKSGRFGSISADLSLQDRLNLFFQNGGGCPNNGRRVDIRNSTLSISFRPFAAR